MHNIVNKQYVFKRYKISERILNSTNKEEISNMAKSLSIDGKMLKFNIKLMDWLNMWPDENKVEKKILRSFKDISSLFNLFIMTIAISSDFVIQVKGDYDEIMDINENLTALGALFVSIYMGVCFMKQRREIMVLVKKLNIFEEFNAQEDMFETERKAALLSKIFVSYGVIGNLSYLAMPYTNMADCRERRAASVYSQDMSCNLITRFRLPFRYQDSWMLYAVVIWQLVACLHTTYVTLAVTMFLISLLMHVIIQMKRLRIMLRNGEDFQKCQRYHDMIIEYCTDVTKAYSPMMLMHITLTSFEISVLCFQVLIAKTLTDSLRFGLHLLGWLVVLFLICFYGQKLIDESTGIGWDTYCTKWYYISTKNQKDRQLMILRSQRPLILTAASLGVMSLETYLTVMSTAYSYFTLLLRMKTD